MAIIPPTAFKAYSTINKFHTTNKIAGYKAAYSSIGETLDNLEKYYANKKYSMHPNMAGEDPIILNMTEQINLAIYENTSSCHLCIRSTLMGKNAITNYILDFLRLTDDENLDRENKLFTLSLAMSLLTFSISCYLLVALFKYEKLKAVKVGILASLTFPIIIICGSFQMVSEKGNFFPTEVEYAGPIICCILYIFIFNPPIIYFARKYKINLRETFMLRGATNS